MPQTGPAWTDTGHVFTRPDGHPWHPTDVTDTFTAAATIADQLRCAPTGGVPLIRRKGHPWREPTGAGPDAPHTPHFAGPRRTKPARFPDRSAPRAGCRTTPARTTSWNGRGMPHPPRPWR
jgi:hypothetical protein